jgi:hypoxanthine phosphoribosyltransferase
MEDLPEPELLYSAETIGLRVSELARQISRDYSGVDELRLVGVLKGAFIFLADLTRRLTVRHRVDFIALSSYGEGGGEQGAVRLQLDLKAPISGVHVLVVDDIVDTGTTLRFVREMLEAHRPASIRTCVLTRKKKDRATDPHVDYVGFEIPDVWTVGYGLDYADRFRTLPFIGSLRIPT